ncbi:SPOR domain-containing protein [Marinobacter sp.]|uniref:SPOR domain-containing protein n=1 Tax=Marinobacter sp. TaxID=50741 RepID=UPI00384AD2ED
MSEDSAGAGKHPEEPVRVASEAGPKRPQPESELPPVAAPRICIEAGWFEDPAEAQTRAEKISGVVGEVTLKQKDKPADPYYWVIIPPAESRAAALKRFRTLQEWNIDSYLVREGDQENAISLGLFSSRASAERVLSLSQARGLEATLATFPRNKIGYSLVFEVRASPGSEQLEEALAGIGSRFESVELNDCEGVATIQKNP